MEPETPPAMSVAVFASTFPPAILGGGPSRTLQALVANAPAHVGVFVLAPDHDLGSSAQLSIENNQWVGSGNRQVYYCSDQGVAGYFGGLRAVRARRPTVVYLNSFFSPTYSLAPQILRIVRFWRGARFLVAPRGEFGAGALELRRTKKRVAIRLFKNLGLHRRVVWHASSVLEANEVRALMGDSAIVLVRENETSLPSRAVLSAGSGDDLALHVVMISRITPKKGLSLLLEAAALVSAPMRIDVYGNHEDRRYLETCRKIVRGLPDNVVCRIHDQLSSSEVADAFASADVFAFPTAGENFGHVIAEALSQSCPVIVSDTTPWSGRLAEGGGEVLKDRTRTTWAAALQSFASLPRHELANQRSLASRVYNEWRSQEEVAHVFDLLADLAKR